MTASDSLVLFLSDLHIGQKHKNYSPSTAKKRLASIPKKLPEAAPQRLVLAVGGDIIEGVDIFPRQNVLIPFGAREQADLAVELFTVLIEKLKDKWPKTRVELQWVLGNHGRTSKSASYSDNWDLEIGARIREVFKKDARVKMVLHTQQPHAIFKVGRTKFYMIHGTARKDVHLATNARKGVVLERLDQHGCDVLLLGHFHQGTHHGSPGGLLKLVVNGALGSPDPFYAEHYGYWNQPAQAVIHVPKNEKATKDSVQWLRW